MKMDADIERDISIHNPTGQNHPEPVAMPKTPLDELTPEQRFQQIAAILAKGVLRCQHRLREAASAPEQVSSESSPCGLEVPGKTRLSMSRCIGG